MSDAETVKRELDELAASPPVTSVAAIDLFNDRAAIGEAVMSKERASMAKRKPKKPSCEDEEQFRGFTPLEQIQALEDFIEAFAEHIAEKEKQPGSAVQ